MDWLNKKKEPEHRNEMKLGLEGQKADLITATKNLEAAMTTGNDKLREIIQKENQQRKQDMMVRWMNRYIDS